MITSTYVSVDNHKWVWGLLGIVCDGDLYLFTDKSDSVLLQTDPANLLHVTKSLEEALAEIKTQHCRRIMRSIK